MSGHNKWSKIKNQKMGTDAKRGMLFTKLTREIIIAVKNGGSDTDSNRRLALAIQKAKSGSMPWENIQRAIEKASGTADGQQLAEMVIEGYGPNGAAILVQAVSDNRNPLRSGNTEHLLPERGRAGRRRVSRLAV
jgi:YebC/PmpR family DNA-binding regulatory protein